MQTRAEDAEADAERLMLHRPPSDVYDEAKNMIEALSEELVRVDPQAYLDVREEFDYPACERDWIDFRHHFSDELFGEEGRNIGDCQCPKCCARLNETFAYWWEQSSNIGRINGEVGLSRTAAPSMEPFRGPWEQRYVGLSSVRSQCADGTPIADRFSADLGREAMVHCSEKWDCLKCTMLSRHDPNVRRCAPPLSSAPRRCVLRFGHKNAII